LTKHFIGSQMAKLRPEWSHLRDNSGSNPLVPTPFYKSCLKIITGFEHKLSSKTTFSYDAKNFYAQLLRETVSAPLLTAYWRVSIGSEFSV